MNVSGFTSIRETQPLRPETKIFHSQQPADRFEQGPAIDPNLPDLSGLARLGRNFVAVTDAKPGSDKPRMGQIDAETGAFKALSSDWGEHRPARDLEAITPLSGQPGEALAVEGSTFGELKNRLFHLRVGEEGSSVKQAFTLPEFSQEIEGLVEMPLDKQRHLVVLGGRGGDKGESGRLYWGILDREEGTLDFPDKGREGVAVQAPNLGPGQRDISELQLRPDGSLWASACVDEGDEGPFKSSIYKLGTLKPDAESPFESASNPKSTTIPGTKIEGFAQLGKGWLTGADNESLGGQVGILA